ncbi:MAG TPA: arsenate reductase ArsC [Bellilinea sp.]|nr:arsenate reductase ArsC [Bellilinea sp.]
MKPVSVLFLCSANSCRSQMAEALLKSKVGDKVEVLSAGIDETEVNPLALKVLRELDLDTSELYSKPLSKFMGKRHFSYLITVCDRANERCPIFPGMGKRLNWPFDDPAAAQGTEAERLKVFRRVRDEINEKLDQFVQEELRQSK